MDLISQRITISVIYKTILSEIPLVETLQGLAIQTFAKKLLTQVIPKESHFHQATIQGLSTLDLQYRDNSRYILTDSDLAQELFELIKEDLPQTYKGWALYGLNDYLRFYSYKEGQHFGMHYDGRYRPKPAFLESRLTLLMYLSEDYEGGETQFFTDEAHFRLGIEPAIGKIVIFDHHQNHNSTPIIKGHKLAFRTDVMYQAGNF